MNIAIITARGGSKRIPRKNIKDFCGKPIIAYSIQAALNANCFEEVMVSTDDKEIAETSIKYGAKIPFMRSQEAANDFATTADVLLEVIHSYHKIGVFPEYVCCLYPTAPFVTPNSLICSFRQLSSNQNSDVVFPVAKFSFPVQRALRFQNNHIEFMYPKNALTRSQDLEAAYHDAGQFYWIRVNSFLDSKTLLSEKTAAFVLPESQVQDIDNIDDWRLAEMKYKFLKNEIVI